MDPLSSLLLCLMMLATISSNVVIVIAIKDASELYKYDNLMRYENELNEMREKLSSSSSSSTLRCPKPQAIQDMKVINEFDLNKFQGTYYEIAYKDITQPRICKCNQSVKKIVEEENRISDSFRLNCGPNNETYVSDLSFNITSNPGVFNGYWRNLTYLSDVIFHDTVVDFKIDPENDQQYKWVIEFQCNEKNEKVSFYAFNFYAQTNKADDVYDEMLTSFIDHGLEPFLNVNRDVHMVDHTNCDYLPDL